MSTRCQLRCQLSSSATACHTRLKPSLAGCLTGYTSMCGGCLWGLLILRLF
ncbi:hypothetical protein [Mycobacterium phage Fezzik]|nr:hypothetical protein [Mycobacterium phage Fezzik]